MLEDNQQQINSFIDQYIQIKLPLTANINIKILEFNNRSSILVIGKTDGNIQIMQFKFGALKHIKELNSTTSKVYCLLFTKQSNQIIYSNNKISIYSEVGIARGSYLFKCQGPKPNCIIINKEENLLIYGSNDKAIRFLRKHNSQWILHQEYKICYYGMIISLSLNDSENYLICLSKLENKIFICQKNQITNYWSLFQIINIKESQGLQVGFIKDSTFILSLLYKGEYFKFYYQNQEKQQFEQFTQIIQDQTCNSLQICDKIQLEIIKQRQILIYKKDNCINLLLIKNQNKIEMIKLVSFNDCNFIFRVTDDGKYILICFTFKAKLNHNFSFQSFDIFNYFYLYIFQLILCYKENLINIMILKQSIYQQVYKHFMNQQEIQEKNNNFEQSISLNLIDDTNQQRDFCYALAFNNDNSILITNSENVILIWDFKFGKMELIQSVVGHSEDVNYLVFSKKTNNFISGSNDNSIRCWKQKNQKEWVSTQEFECNSYVYTLKLNNSENQLISGGFNGQINIWQLNFNNDQNELQLIQTLHQHSSTVYDLSLNKSETQFISCSKDNLIIVWKLQLNNYWEYQYVVKQSINDFGCKIQFINDNQFIWVSGGQYSQDCIYTYELKDGIFEEIPNLKLQLLKDLSYDDIFQFPIVYLKQQNIMIIRHKAVVYVVQQQQNGQFKISYQLNLQTNVIFGTLTSDAKYLIIKSNQNNKYMIYELKLS